MKIGKNIGDMLVKSDKYYADTFIELNVPLLKREKELSELRNILSDFGDQVALVTGVAGIGKST